MAPDAKDSSGCATTRLGSKNVMCPNPSQLGQAPIGLLNENNLGSSSCNEYEHTGHANLLEKSCSSFESISKAMALPSASLSAVSNDSAKRC